ncbi:iron-sulfur cluster assembly protein, partial [Methylovulum sp.]|uniref:iron-sulfur cluster assembly protein n=1 Tax=Methylovulum sp. TaxID=1916980 RepID=UPI0026129FAB
MSSIEKAAIEQLLKTFIDPNHGVDLVTAKSVKSISIDGGHVSVKIELGYPAKSIIQSLQAAIEQ